MSTESTSTSETSGTEGAPSQGQTTGTSSPATARTTVLGGSGGQEPTTQTPPAGDWSASLPEDLRGLVKTKGWKGIDEALGSYANLERLVGGEKVVVPGADAKPEDWDAFFTKAGRPAKAEDYKIDRPKELPSGFPYNDQLAEAFKPVAHKLGLLPAQVQGLHQFLVEQNVGMFQAASEARTKAGEQGLAQLKQEWGKDFDQKGALAARAVKEFGGPDLAKWMDETGLGDNPNFIKLFANVGAALGESGLVGGGGGGGGGATTSPAQAVAEIERLMADKSFQRDLTGDSGPAAKKAAQERWDRLNTTAAGEEA